jgi:hypothetical protein
LTNYTQRGAPAPPIHYRCSKRRVDGKTATTGTTTLGTQTHHHVITAIPPSPPLPITHDMPCMPPLQGAAARVCTPAVLGFAVSDALQVRAAGGCKRRCAAPHNLCAAAGPHVLPPAPACSHCRSGLETTPQWGSTPRPTAASLAGCCMYNGRGGLHVHPPLPHHSMADRQCLGRSSQCSHARTRPVLDRLKSRPGAWCSEPHTPPHNTQRRA